MYGGVGRLASYLPMVESGYAQAEVSQKCISNVDLEPILHAMLRLTAYLSIVTCLVLFASCDSTGSSKTVPEVEYSGEVTTVETNDAGGAQIKSDLSSQGDEYDLTINVTTVDRRGDPVSGAEVQYGQLNGKSFIMLGGPEGDRVPFTFFGTPEEMVDRFSGSIEEGGGNSSSESKAKEVVITATIGLTATVLSLGYAQYKFFTNAYRVEKFYLTDQVESGEDYTVYCKRFSDIAGLINARTGTALSGASIGINLVTAGTGALAGGTLEGSSLVLDAGLIGTEKLRDAIVERAIENWGEQADAINDKKPVEVRVYFAEGDGAGTALKNLYARFDIIRNSPRCESDDIVYKIGNFEGHEYYISKPEVTRNWNEARSVADEVGGHLVTISDKEEEEFVLQNIENIENRNENGWTGLTDRENEGNFKWITGEEVTYTNWCSGEPNDLGTEDAVILRFDAECWNDADIVNDDRGFIVEVE